MVILSLFFFNDTATTEIYTLSLHDALPILKRVSKHGMIIKDKRKEGDVMAHLSFDASALKQFVHDNELGEIQDRKSTRLNSSHANISYAVFCLKKKNFLKITLNILFCITIL